MGRRKIKITPVPNYGASVAVSATEMQKAVNKLKAYNIVDSMFTAILQPIIFKQMAGDWDVIRHNDRPDWIQKLEKEWGIR